MIVSRVRTDHIVREANALYQKIRSTSVAYVPSLEHALRMEESKLRRKVNCID